MALKDPILAGEQLIPSGIRSENYAAGVSGWRIAKDGSAEFYGVVIRADLESANFAAGVAGWRLQSASGDAELNQATVRGTLTVGGDNPATLAPFVGNTVALSLSSGGGEEAAPARISNVYQFIDDVGAGESMSQLRVASSNDNQGASLIDFEPPGDIAGAGGRFKFYSGRAGTPGQVVFMNSDMAADDTVLWVQSRRDASLGEAKPPIMVGMPGEDNVIIDNNEVMARSNGAESTLFLNNDGGALAAPWMRSADSFDAGPRSTASTSYVRAGGSADVTVRCPSSKLIDVDVDARLSISTGTATHAACVTWEARAGSSGGAVLVAANDVNAGITRGNTVPMPGGRARTLDLTGLASTGDLVWIGAMIRSNNAANTATAEQISVRARASF